MSCTTCALFVRGLARGARNRGSAIVSGIARDFVRRFAFLFLDINYSDRCKDGIGTIEALINAPQWAAA